MINCLISNCNVISKFMWNNILGYCVLDTRAPLHIVFIGINEDKCFSVLLCVASAV